MPTNNLQPNTDDFSEFDFDESDVLVKDGKHESTKAPLRQAQGRLQHENTHSASSGQATTRKHENKTGYVDRFAVPANVSLLRRQMGAPLDLKKIKVPFGAVDNIQGNLAQQAKMQKDKIEALKRTGEGFVYDEKDEEEIEKFKNNHLIKSGLNIDLLARTLMSRLDIVSTLKIVLIQRLKNIIDSFLRDIRTAAATEELLQRSLDNGGLNLPPEHARQIMDFISNEHKRIHSNVFTAAENNIEERAEKKNKENNLLQKNAPLATNLTESAKSSKIESPKKKSAAPSKVELLKIESLEKKLIASPKVELLKEAVETISKKTAREAQIGIFSDEIANSRKQNNSKTRFETDNKKDLTQQKKESVIPYNLRVPEISAPKVVAQKVSPTELPKVGERKKPIKNDILSQDFNREEFLKSFDEELTQDENQAQDLKKKKKSWLRRLFWRKPIQSSKSIKQENTKTRKQENTKTRKQENNDFREVPKPAPSLPKGSKFQVPSVVRRVIQNKPNFDNRPKMEDVKIVHPHLVGPTEELSEMTLLDFRRLGSTAQDSIDKIKEKIEISAKEFFNQKIVAINSWRKSQPNQLYIELGRQSLSQKAPVEDLIKQYISENKPTLTKEEFDLISKLNKELRY